MDDAPADGSPQQAREKAGGGLARTPAAGWYPTPTGEQRYWDGFQWLELPPPADPAPPAQADHLVPGPTKSARKWTLIAVSLVLLLGLVGGGIAWKVAHDERVATERAEAAAAQAAAEEEEREERREAAAEAAQERRDTADREERRLSVTEIEASVKTMAEGHAADGLIDGPIIEVSCSPVGGGSTDDLTEQTTVFKCFVANEDNGDGTMSGYSYNATMNWSSGSYTYGIGAP